MRYRLRKRYRRYYPKKNPAHPAPCLCLSSSKELVNESKIEIPEAIPSGLAPVWLKSGLKLT